MSRKFPKGRPQLATTARADKLSGIIIGTTFNTFPWIATNVACEALPRAL